MLLVLRFLIDWHAKSFRASFIVFPRVSFIVKGGSTWFFARSNNNILLFSEQAKRAGKIETLENFSTIFFSNPLQKQCRCRCLFFKISLEKKLFFPRFPSSRCLLYLLCCCSSVRLNSEYVHLYAKHTYK